MELNSKQMCIYLLFLYDERGLGLDFIARKCYTVGMIYIYIFFIIFIRCLYMGVYTLYSNISILVEITLSVFLCVCGVEWFCLLRKKKRKHLFWGEDKSYITSS